MMLVAPGQNAYLAAQLTLVSPHLPQNPSRGELEPLTVTAVPKALLTGDCHFSADRISLHP